MTKLCLECGVKLDSNKKKRCSECQKIFARKKSLQYYYEKLRPYKPEKFCETCNESLGNISSAIYCETCAASRRKEKFVGYKKGQRSKYSEEKKLSLIERKRLRRRERKEQGQCPECGRTPDNGLVYCEKCVAANNRASMRLNRKRGHLPAGQSGGEEYIYNLLDKDLHIIKRYRGLIISPLTNARMEIDLWLPDIRLAIEVDGPMHRRDAGYGEERFLYQVQQDRIKDTFCHEHNIELLRIATNEKYWKDQEQLKIILSQDIQWTKSRIEGATHNG